MANMNENKKKRPVNHTTPKAEVMWSHVVGVDHGTEQYPDKEGSYNITVKMPEAQAKAFLKGINNEIQEAQDNMDEEFSKLSIGIRKKLVSPEFIMPGNVEYDRDTEEETGNIIFRFKTNAQYKDRSGVKHERKVPVFDCMGQPTKLKTELGFGSVVKVAFTAVPYFVSATGKAGITFYLNAVQVLSLTSFGDRSASSFGFGEEDGDFAMGDSDSDNMESTEGTYESAVSDGSENYDDVPF